jgi:hypothetical protein
MDRPKYYIKYVVGFFLQYLSQIHFLNIKVNNITSYELFWQDTDLGVYVLESYIYIYIRKLTWSLLRMN